MMGSVLLCLAALLPQAQEFKHRITGLWDHAREDDLREAVKKMPGVALVAIDFDRAEATLSYDPAKLSSKSQPKEILERLDNLLRTASASTFGVKPLSTTPKEKLTRVEIGVQGLDCKGCCLGVYESISKIDGVEQATVSLKEGRLTALIDPDRTTRAALVEALTKRGVTLKTP